MYSSKANIIAMLEDWAIWEKSLEDAAAQDELARSIKEAADRPTSSTDDAGNKNELAKVTGHTVIVCPGKGSVSFVSNANGDATATHGERRVRPTMSRQRSLRSRRDPIEMARWQALKAWTAERVRRCSSDATSDITRGGSVVKLSKTAPEWGASTRSLRHSFPPRMTMSQDDISTWDGQVLARRDSRTCQQQLSVSAHVPLRPDSKCLRHDPRPWRTNMKKTSSKLALSADAHEAVRPEAQTAPSTPRSPQSATDTSQIRRPSPWAQSPSRETAGGVLVNQRFFYGSGGRLTPARVPDDHPDFEAGWMRQFREEMESDSEWWARRDTFHQHQGLKSPESRRCSGTGRVRRSDGAVKHSDYRRGGHDKGTQPVDLWREVGSCVARRTLGGMEYVLGGDAHTGTSESEGIDVLSIQDRLRYTPLSQGTWVVDRAAKLTRSEANGSSPEKIAPGPPSCSAGEGNAAVTDKLRLGRDRENRGSYDEGEEECGAVPQKVTEVLLSHAGVTHDESSGERKEQRGDNTLQGVYDDILVKLRGKIDSSTREGIVLRAAEDARGALARAQQSNVSPRSRRTYSSGAPGDALDTLDTLAAAENDLPGQEVIDYDHVEATLSLIELASRAAGPDAGRQMLRALEGLTKIHQQVRLEERRDGGENSPEEVDAEGEGRRGDRSSVAESDSRSQALSNIGCEHSHDSANGVLSAISSWFWKGKDRESSRQAAAHARENDDHCGDEGNSKRGTHHRLDGSGTPVDGKLEGTHSGQPDHRLFEQPRAEEERENTSNDSSVYNNWNEKLESKGDDDAMISSAAEKALDVSSRFRSPAAEQSSSDLSAGGDTGDTTEEYHMAWDGSSIDKNNTQQQSAAADPVVAMNPRNKGCISATGRKLSDCISSGLTSGKATPRGKECNDSQPSFAGMREDAWPERSLQKAHKHAKCDTATSRSFRPRIGVRTYVSKEVKARVTGKEQEHSRRHSGTGIPASRTDERKTNSRRETNPPTCWVYSTFLHRWPTKCSVFVLSLAPKRLL